MARSQAHMDALQAENDAYLAALQAGGEENTKHYTFRKSVRVRYTRNADGRMLPVWSSVSTAVEVPEPVRAGDCGGVWFGTFDSDCAVCHTPKDTHDFIDSGPAV